MGESGSLGQRSLVKNNVKFYVEFRNMRTIIIETYKKGGGFTWLVSYLYRI